jgi:SNF2 family DNA or RNA helicase
VPDHIPNLILINYEVVFQLEAELLALCEKFKVGLFPDEMHKIANPQAKVTKTFLKLAPRAAWRLGATGTPVKDRTGEGLWSQWYFIDLGTTFGANFVQFGREFFDENPWTHERTPKRGTLEIFAQRVARRSVRFLKTDFLDLPPKVYETLEGERGPDQQRAYDQMEEELLAEFGDDPDAPSDVATAATQMGKAMRLAQITSGHLPTTSGQMVRFTPNPKVGAIAELVDEQVSQQQIIVWAYFREDHDALVDALAKHKPLLIRGGMPPSKTDAAEAAFQAGDCRVLVGQQGAMGEGKDFPMASLAIYMSQQYSLIQREQSEDRSHRGGSEVHSKVTYVDVVARDTVDLDVAEALKAKRSVAEAIVDIKRRLRGR